MFGLDCRDGGPVVLPDHRAWLDGKELSRDHREPAR
jgi:hypothetical protein